VIGLSITFIIAEEFIVGALGNIPALKDIKFLENIFPVHNYYRAVGFYGGGETAGFLIGSSVLAVTAVLAAALGVWTFRKRDV
jgi:hypothetical protein